MVPAHDTDDVSLLLREANGTQFSLDFGQPLQGPPGGLTPMQLVTVVGVLDAGELPPAAETAPGLLHEELVCPAWMLPALPQKCRVASTRGVCLTQRPRRWR